MSNNPYTDRMNAIAALRTQKLKLDAQINDEITRAWRLAPTKNLKTFASSLGMTQASVQAVLAAKGINATIVP
jgi:hypothetical protein